MYIERDKKSWLIVKVGAILSMRHNDPWFFNQKSCANFLTNLKLYFMYINCANCDVYSMQMITANNDNNFLLLIEVSHDKSANCAAIDVSNMCLSLKLLRQQIWKKKLYVLRY